MNIRGIFLLIGILIFGWSAIPVADAQFNLEGFSDLIGSGGFGRPSALPEFGEVAPGVGGLFESLTLIASPSYPDPYSTFDIELSAPSQDFAGSLIKWYINGEEDLTARNKRLHTLTAGGLGEKMTIRTTLQKQSGETSETTLVITPVIINVVLESDTTIPDFYAGRALPSRGSHARAVAIITTGEDLDRDTLSYRWELNGNVLEAGAIRGLQAVNFDMPLSFESFLNITISNASEVLGKKSVRIIPAEPEIVFYEENPLLGISGHALANRATLFGNQITVRAEPYYLSPFLNKPNYLVEWSLSGKVVDNSSSPELNAITLRSDGTTSEGNITLRMADLSTLSMPTTNSVYLKFGF